MDTNDPHGLIGFDVPAADGGNYGLRVTGYSPKINDYYATPIRWSTGEVTGETRAIDAFKVTYRYKPESKRPSP
jgi:hypothetical protein